MRIRAIRHQFTIRASIDYKMHPKRIHIYLTEITEILRIAISQWESLWGLGSYARHALGLWGRCTDARGLWNSHGSRAPCCSELDQNHLHHR